MTEPASLRELAEQSNAWPLAEARKIGALRIAQNVITGTRCSFSLRQINMRARSTS
jgi:hypothetical protein